MKKQYFKNVTMRFCRLFSSLCKECICWIRISPLIILAILFVLGLYANKWNLESFSKQIFDAKLSFIIIIIIVIFIVPLSYLFSLLIDKIKQLSKVKISFPRAGLEVEGVQVGRGNIRDNYINYGNVLLRKKRYIEAFFQYNHAFALSKSVLVAYRRLECLVKHYEDSNDPKINISDIRRIYEEAYEVICKKNICDIPDSYRRKLYYKIKDMEADILKTKNNEEFLNAIKSHFNPEPRVF